MATAELRLRPRRRKIALACEPCRERKSRCDGTKPVCLACQRRGVPLEQCLYKTDNARSASNDEYIKVLHDRIRQLEQTCQQNGIPIPPLAEGTVIQPQAPVSADAGATPLASSSSASGPCEPPQLPGQPELSPGLSLDPPPDVPTGISPVSRVSQDHAKDRNDSSGISAMGTILAETSVSSSLAMTEEFYGGSSAASFIQEAYATIDDGSRRPGQNLSTHNGLSPGALYERGGGPTHKIGLRNLAVDADRFCLPPRALADKLLAKFWEHAYHLYPVFHRPAFEFAYEKLWHGSTGPDVNEPTCNDAVGLGSSTDASADSPVFHSALNAMLALGCVFSNSSATDMASMSSIFFLRCKRFLDLDFIENNSLAVVQTLLLISLFLQSTNFPSRCWNAVGIACRIAQSLGLHTEPRGLHAKNPLELEIRRRTWHGCVVLDVLVSMTFGRPTMTAKLSQPRLPSPYVLDSDAAGGEAVHVTLEESSNTIFYREHIKLCWILGEVLDKLYHPPRNSSGDQQQPHETPQNYRDNLMNIILELSGKFSNLEHSVQTPLSWKYPADFSSYPEKSRLALRTQRTVLHKRFLYFQIMLYRPVLTQLCISKWAAMRPDSCVIHENKLCVSFEKECARMCIEAAMELVNLISGSYLASTSGAWWWDGLSGIVLIICQANTSLSDTLDREKLRRCWEECQEILSGLASFNTSSHDSLKHLQNIYDNVASNMRNHRPRREGSANAASGTAPANGVSDTNEYQAAGFPFANFRGFDFDIVEEVMSNPNQQMDFLFGGPAGFDQDWSLPAGALPTAESIWPEESG